MVGQARELGEMAMVGMSHRDIARIIDKLKAVTAEQVKEVAGKYFSEDSLTVATLIPLPLSEKTTPQPSSASSGRHLR
jgi:zinc protease